MTGVLIAFALIALIDLPTILRKKMWKDLAAFLTLFVPGLAIAVLLALKVPLPSAMKVLGDLVRAMGLAY